MTTKEAERVKLEEWGNPFGFEYLRRQSIVGRIYDEWETDLAYVLRYRSRHPQKDVFRIRLNPFRNCK